MYSRIPILLAEMSGTHTTHLDRQSQVKKADHRPPRYGPAAVAARPDDALFSGLPAEVTEPPGDDGTAASADLAKATDPQGGSTPQPLEAITEIEARILEGIAAGSSSTQMASRLYMSRQGIEYHVTGMLRKFHAPNRSALVSRAYCSGLLSVASWPPRVLPERVK
jgi:DNA-binding CsgD family transcriptional regulator